MQFHPLLLSDSCKTPSFCWVQIAQRTLGGGGGSSKAPPARSGGGGGLACLVGH